MPVVPSVYRCAQGTYNLHPNNDQRNTQESLSKAKSFTSAEGCSHRPYPDRQNTLSGESAQFFPFCTWGKEDLEAGRTRKFFWAISLRKQFEIRTSGDKQLLV
jgi:hypothetical protein